MILRREAFERSGVARAEIDELLNLTDEEFRVEQSIVVVGPLWADQAVERLTDLLEERGLVYFEDFFELSGNWPEWLAVLVMSGEG